MGFATPVAPIISSLLLCGLLSSAKAEPIGYIRVTLDGPMVAYQRIVYQLEAAHGAFVARITEVLGHGYDERSRIALLTRAEWQKWINILREHRRLQGGSAHQPEKTRYRLTVKNGNNHYEVTLKDPELGPKTEVWSQVLSLLDFVRERVEPDTYWDRRLIEKERGSLRIQSTPRAEILLDGVPLGRKTPVLSLPVAAGEHSVQLIHPETSQKWSYSVFVKAQATTVLKVELK